MAHIVTEDTSSTDQSDQPAVEITRRQPLVPLVVLGLITTALGFYVVYLHQSDVAVERAREVVEAPDLELDLSEEVKLETSLPPVELLYKFPHPSKQRYRLRQTSRRRVGDVESESVETRMSFVFDAVAGEDVEEKEGAKRRELAWTLSNFRTSITSGERPIAGAITAQLEDVLERAQARSMMSDVGRIEQFEWTTANNPQTVETLALISGNARLLSPRFPRQLIRVGDTWSYEVPFPGAAGADGATVEGSLSVENKLLGGAMIDGSPLVVVEQKLRVVASGEYLPEGEGASKITYQVKGRGRGIVHFNQEVGLLHHHGVMLDQTVVIEAKGRDRVEETTRIEMSTSRAQ